MSKGAIQVQYVSLAVAQRKRKSRDQSFLVTDELQLHNVCECRLDSACGLPMGKQEFINGERERSIGAQLVVIVKRFTLLAGICDA